MQLQLLTATVKLFLKRPNEAAQKMISLVLSCATNDTDNPDLRDRAYIYWRLLSTDPEAAKDVVLSEKPVIMDDSSNLDPLLLDRLLGQVGVGRVDPLGKVVGKIVRDQLDCCWLVLAFWGAC